MKVLRKIIVAALVVASGFATAQANELVKGAAEEALRAHVSGNQKLDALLGRYEGEVKARGYNLESWRAEMRMAFAKTGTSALTELQSAQNLDEVVNIVSGGRLAAFTVSRANGDRAKVLGDADIDLVYTPVTPCRLVDTRGPSGGGPFTAFGQVRRFFYNSRIGAGATALSCLTGKVFEGSEPAALHLTITAVTTTFGNLEVRPAFGTATSSSVNFGANESAANSLTVPLCRGCGEDFEIAVQMGPGIVDFSVDVLGFFSAPKATALECVETANTNVSIAAGSQGNTTAPMCLTGFTQTATNCEATSYLMPIVYFQDGLCSARNNDTVTSQTLRASRTCCRVPGF
jgi:hypothetical protein